MKVFNKNKQEALVGSYFLFTFAFYFTFIHDLPYESKWGRMSVYLYSVHNGSGYGIFYNQPVSEYGTWLESSISEICPD